MAIDESLLESAAENQADRSACPTLRIYGWATPTLSLGYFQTATDRATHKASRDCDLIRRPSGGGAILHDYELTYALVLPPAIAKSRPATQWYFAVHNGLVEAIRTLTTAKPTLCEHSDQRPASQQPFLCFQRRTEGDVLLGDHKIAGSAQRRRRDAILQHGSVLLKRSLLAPELPGLAELANTEVSMAALSDSFATVIADMLCLNMILTEFSDFDKRAANSLAENKYGTPNWTLRR